jgi:hypothetical protein
MGRATAFLFFVSLLTPACDRRSLGSSGTFDLAFPTGLTGDFGAPGDMASTVDGSTTDLAKGGSPASVSCGLSTCDVSGGNVCCILGSLCQPPPCNGPSQVDACDGPEDCAAGQTCCLYVGAVFGTACTANCTTTGDQRGAICHTQADCAPGAMCEQLEVGGNLKGCFAQ